MIEKRITMALVLALILETTGALLWAGAAAQRINALEEKVEIARPLSERLARVETRLAIMRVQLDRIEARITDHMREDEE